MRFWSGIALLLLAAPALNAATIVGIVSDRSSAEMAAGAEKHLEAFPEHEIVLRTPEQLKDVSDEQVVSLWDDADALILAAVFGEESGRIRRLVRDQGPGADVPIMAMNSKRGITRLSWLDGEPVMDSLSDKEVNEMVANPEPGEDPPRTWTNGAGSTPNRPNGSPVVPSTRAAVPSTWMGSSAGPWPRPGTTLTSRNPNPANPSATTAMVRPAPTRIP